MNIRNIIVFISMLLMALVIIGGVSASDDAEASDVTALDDSSSNDVSHVNTIEKTSQKNLKQQTTVYVSPSGRDTNAVQATVLIRLLGRQ